MAKKATKKKAAKKKATKKKPAKKKPAKEPCADCQERGFSTRLREPYSGEFDPTLGLAPRSESGLTASQLRTIARWGGSLQDPDRELFQCRRCATPYLRTVERASMFHDYDDYQFYQLSP